MYQTWRAFQQHHTLHIAMASMPSMATSAVHPITRFKSATVCCEPLTTFGCRQEKSSVIELQRQIQLWLATILCNCKSRDMQH